MQYQMTFLSPMGMLLLTSDGTNLTRLDFVDGQEETLTDTEMVPVFEPVIRWLDAYFLGEPIAVDFPMKPAGTPFQQLIWKLLLEIPFGQTRTYGHLAQETARLTKKEKMSAQAVGQAVGRNPINIIVPCHRVIGAGGELTGYSSGIHRKVWLLEHEQKNKENAL